MKEFGGKSELEFTDLIGNQLKIDRNIFLDISGKWKIMKGERAKWLLYRDSLLFVLCRYRQYRQSALLRLHE